jgi:DNA mismatch repair protein MutS2
VSLFAPIPLVVEQGSYDALEWNRLLVLAAGFAHSQVAREWLLALKPSCDLCWINGEHALLEEMQLLQREGAPPPSSGLFDPSRLAAKAHIAGACLEPEEIHDLLGLIETITEWQAMIDHPPEALAAQLSGLMALSRLPSGAQLPSLLRSCRARLNPDGSLADSASLELKRIRQQIERQRQAIEESLCGTLRRLSDGGEARDELITIRGERFVIPVKQEFKRRIPGVVHGASSSGQTVYLEPLETIEQNNELVRLLDEEQAEARRIYLGMTREIGVQGEAIIAGASSLAVLDTLQARARFATAFDCVRPQFASPASPRLSLTGGRHPLVEHRLREGARPGSIVPLTLELDQERRQLIISGPNTGGKTVALKTVGLLSMMAQAGIPVPAREAVFPLFTAYLADIGDVQSIEHGLSAFSAHIATLNRIVSLADGGSLVLLDELGGATDPEEGAALAVAAAGYLLRRRAWCLISTHHTALKVYAAEEQGVINAAVGFDQQTLAPAYELRLGVPGPSAGINIAERLGLEASIVEEARSRLNTQTGNIAGFLDQLHAQLNAVQEEREQLRSRERELEREKSRLAGEGMKEWRAKVRDLERQVESLLKDFSYRIRETVQAIDDRAAQQKLSKEAERRMARLRQEFSEQFNSTVAAQHGGADKGDQNAQPHLVRHVPLGSTVKLKSLGKSGRVVRQLEGDLFEIAVGPMKMRVARDDIAAIEGGDAPGDLRRPTPVDAARRRGISVTLASPEAASSEINVIGRTVDEAAGAVEQFLDRAFMAGLPRVRIVHGMGMGILRRALRTLLERHPHVAAVEEASQREGGAGATIVDLRQ